MPNRVHLCRGLIVMALATLLPGASAAAAQVAVPEAKDSLVSKGVALEKAATRPRLYETPDGYTFRVASRHFGGRAKAEVATVVAALRHGPEIRHLSVYLATRRELDGLCGGWTMACYDPEAGLIFVLGDSEPVSGIPREVVIAHEYGHHLAHHRASSLWPALAMGTKRWATAEGVCGLTRRRLVFPGAASSHYWENPGEAFAQAYAELNFPASAPWYYSPLLAPDPAALEALELDLESTRPTALVFLRAPDPGAAHPRGAAAVQRVVPIPHDGRIRVSIRGSAPAQYRITFIDPQTGGILEARVTTRARLSRSAHMNCGRRQLSIHVRQIGGAGSFVVGVQRP